MKKNYIISYGVLRKFFNAKKDILDIYLPFIETVLISEKQEYVEKLELKEKIKEEHGLDIPISVINRLIKKLKKRNQIEFYEKNNKYIHVCSDALNDTELYNLEFENCKRDINKFIDSYREYSEDNVLTDEEILDIIMNFLELNIDMIDLSENDIDIDSYNTNDKHVLKMSEYVANIKDRNSAMYSIFSNIYYGYILSNFTLNDESIYQNYSQNIPKFNVYFDSNYLFRILNLQNELLNCASCELKDIMSSYNFKFYVYSDTIDEIRNILNKKMNDIVEGRVAQTVPKVEAQYVEGVLGAIYRQGWDLYELKNFINNLEDILKNLNINVIGKVKVDISELDYNDISELFKVKLRNYLKNKMSENIVELENETDEYLFSKYKTLYNRVITDLKIIKDIRKKRGSRYSKFHQCKSFFLSCDKVLANFNKKNNLCVQAVPEVIEEDYLTNILWINNPSRSDNISIMKTIAIFQSTHYIDYKILHKFRNAIQKYDKNNPEKAHLLADIYDNQEVMSDVKELSLNNNDNEDVLDELLEKFVVDKKQKEDNMEYEILSVKNELVATVDELQKKEQKATEYKTKAEKYKKESINSNNVNKKLISNSKKVKLFIDKFVNYFVNFMIIIAIIVISVFIWKIVMYLLKIKNGGNILSAIGVVGPILAGIIVLIMLILFGKRYTVYDIVCIIKKKIILRLYEAFDISDEILNIIDENKKEEN